MTDLVLIDTDDNDKVLATVVPDGSGIKATGAQADAAKQIVMARAELMDMTPARTLTRLADYGWTNGRWALVEKE